jgi:hypothetical protein
MSPDRLQRQDSRRRGKSTSWHPSIQARLTQPCSADRQSGCAITHVKANTYNGSGPSAGAQSAAPTGYIMEERTRESPVPAKEGERLWPTQSSNS